MPQLKLPRMLQLKDLHAATKSEDPRAVTKTRHSQINEHLFLKKETLLKSYL